MYRRSPTWKANDALLRRRGFRLLDRPEGCEPRWIRDGRVHFETHALDECHKELKALETRKAFSLVELLVVIAIIAVLMSLLLPAVQKVREAAAVARCQNNLKQWSLALVHHDSMIGHLPAAGRDIPRQSWIPHIWPFVEQTALNKRYKFDRSFRDQTGETFDTPYGATIPLYYCSSDRPLAVQQLDGYWRARGNYVLNWGTYPSPLPIGVNPTIWGPFGWEDFRGPTRPRISKLSDFIDGVSNTLLVAETLMPSEEDDFDQRGDILEIHPGCNGFQTDRTPNSTFPDELTACVNRPAMPCVSGKAWNDVAARSRHAGGVNAARADGSVSFVSDRITASVWHALGSINGGD